MLFFFVLCIFLSSFLQNRHIINPIKKKIDKEKFLVTSNGSTTMSPLLEMLSEEFSKINPSFSYQKSETGSAAAVTSVIQGVSDLGDMSRKLKNEEISENIVQKTLALDGIAIIVNNSNPIINLESKEIKEIFEGKVKNWSEIYPNFNSKISVVGREDASGTREEFENKLNVFDPNYHIILNESGDISAKVSNCESAIGYVSIASVSGNVHKIKVDGIVCSYENIKNGTYPINRPFLQIYKKKLKNEAIEKWFKFLETKNAEKIIDSYFNRNN
ncbi:MAG: phosphate ABC transporter substrate-binding protein [Oscillospiraceae bacterium]|jgi:phosphate transport system substrate-binding protein|nr:phosphate ABC transporter substrate-binding protein [Oscillospiraceae bacterium]